MNISKLALLVSSVAGASALMIANAPLGASDKQPVLVELFTSQGCSSCPPADALAAKLAAEPGLVVVTRPVTYWDRLGWKDTLALEANTTLQRAYAARGLAGNNGVYTPQVVVDGERGAVGSNAAQIRQLIGQSAGANAAIAIRRVNGGGVAIGIAGPANARGELVLLALSAKESVKIGRGENGGRRVDYANVLRSERKIADWRGGKMSHALTADALTVPGANRFALVLREPKGGKILASRMIPAS